MIRQKGLEELGRSPESTVGGGSKEGGGAKQETPSEQVVGLSVLSDGTIESTKGPGRT